MLTQGLPNLKHAYAKSWYFKIATFRSSNAKRLHLTEIVWPGGASHNPPSAGEALELRAATWVVVGVEASDPAQNRTKRIGEEFLCQVLSARSPCLQRRSGQCRATSGAHLPAAPTPFKTCRPAFSQALIFPPPLGRYQRRIADL